METSAKYVHCSMEQMDENSLLLKFVPIFRSGHGKKDSGCGSIISLDTLRRVRDLCEHHLSVGSEAEEHYRKVCRALVSESVELALFLEKAQKQVNIVKVRAIKY